MGDHGFCDADHQISMLHQEFFLVLIESCLSLFSVHAFFFRISTVHVKQFLHIREQSHFLIGKCHTVQINDFCELGKLNDPLIMQLCQWRVFNLEMQIVPHPDVGSRLIFHCVQPGSIYPKRMVSEKIVDRFDSLEVTIVDAVFAVIGGKKEQYSLSFCLRVTKQFPETFFCVPESRQLFFF